MEIPPTQLSASKSHGHFKTSLIRYSIFAERKKLCISASLIHHPYYSRIRLGGKQIGGSEDIMWRKQIDTKSW